MKRSGPLKRTRTLVRSGFKRRTHRRDPIPTDVRLAVFARDGGCVLACRIVGADLSTFEHCAWAVEFHHKLRRSQGGAHTAENLITLCSAHHAYVHDHPAWAYEHGYLTRRHEGAR